ncbi:ComEC/Rec2 family competence protein [Desulforamulus aeronauticus]|uniref:Metallo-beta-lactamase superfamily protein n=1 Tax=Desulforamulus aeronauticus DSM 10349 TaxID=1121421 RepID=A0A1M6QF32_9FIRM|nr:MBL fold metallo-hydrolase [Desulforamulus aeronauticus]SHK18879.1 Metallo-beta-lactamase superfamily protein [Desulforamulus aeronauticus DSM 10349]
MSIKINVLPAYDGDCFIINYGDGKNIIVDGGRGPRCIRELKKSIKEISKRNQNVDLLVVTHIDHDHISGILALFKDPTINKNIFRRVWFNSGENLSKYFGTSSIELREIPMNPQTDVDISFKEGDTLECYLKTLTCWDQSIIKTNDYYEIGGAILTVLSPNIESIKYLNEKWEIENGLVDTRISFSGENDYDRSIAELLNNKFVEDNSIPNRSSIAFLFEFNNKKILMLGDSAPSIVSQSLEKMGFSKENKIELDLMKVSHHGSKANTSPDFLDLVNCNKYVISTNGVNHGLPHKECLARIICKTVNKATFIFNYPLDNIFLEDDYLDWLFECKYISEDNFTLEV